MGCPSYLLCRTFLGREFLCTVYVFNYTVHLNPTLNGSSVILSGFNILMPWNTRQSIVWWFYRTILTIPLQRYDRLLTWYLVTIMRPQNTAKLHNHVCHAPQSCLSHPSVQDDVHTSHFSLCVSVYKLSLFLVENQYTCVSVFTNSYAASKAHRCAGCLSMEGNISLWL